jgi:regulatory protein
VEIDMARSLEQADEVNKAPRVRVAALEPVPRQGAVRVRLDDGRELLLPIEEGLALHTGDPLDAARAHQLEGVARRWELRERAVRLLAVRARGREELRRRLRRHAYPEEEIAACLAELDARGYLDDRAFADAFVRDRMRFHPRSRRQLLAELRNRGVDADIAEAAVAAGSPPDAELELARQVAARWTPRPGEEPRAARRRLTGRLARRGFPGSLVRQVVEERLG